MKAHPLAIALLVPVLAAAAQEPPPDQRAAPALETGSSSRLPLRKVVLYKNGVGYFERRGTVTGDAVVPLSFETEQMRDVLKTLFAVDLGGGQVPVIRYESKTPVEQQLDDVLFRVPGENSLTALLQQLQGVRMEITVGARTVRGRVLGVQSLERRIEGDTVTTYRLVLLRDDGAMETLELFEAQHLQILDEDVQDDLGRMMEVLARARHADQKTVELYARGRGTRELRIGYVLETPLWKTSYRLLLGEDQPPRLQGWAIAENPTDEDWEDVALTFVAGSPMTFVLDLYTQYYPHRPVIDMGQAAAEGAGEKTARLRVEARRRAGNREDLAFGRPAAEAEAPAAADLDDARLGELLQSTLAPTTEGVAIGELFAYESTAPVSIEAHQAALVPILLAAAEGSERVLYHRPNLGRVPSHAVRLVNSTALTLEKGPVTVYQSATLLGEAMLPRTLEPGMEAMLPYALEPAVEIETRTESRHRPVTQATLHRGILRLTRMLVTQIRYAVRNRTEEGRVLFLDHPKPGGGYELVQPEEPFEEKTGHWRFRLELPAAGERALVVRMQQPQETTISIANQDLQQIRFYLQQDYLSDEARGVLEQVAAAMEELRRIERELADLRQERERLREDQETIRRNIQVLRDSPQERELRDTYVQRLARAVERTDEIDRRVRELERQKSEVESRIGATLEAFSDR